MNRSEAASFERICKTIVGALGDVSRKLNRRIMALEAENKELRQLWINHEKAEIENKVRIDAIYRTLRDLGKDES